MATFRFHLSLNALVVSVLISSSPSVASADQVKFAGVHPISARTFCYIEAPHVHIYRPKKAKLLYRIHDGHYHFVGDPVAHSYDGPKFTYYGHHPVPVGLIIAEDNRDHFEFCYLNGPHFHYYKPPANIKFTLKGGAYWFVGTYPGHYHKGKKIRVRINGVYVRIKYPRPVVVMSAPAGYVGPFVKIKVGKGKVRGKVRGGVDIRIPTPSIRVEVDVPGLVFGHDHHRHRKHHKHKRHRKHRKHKRHHKHKRFKHKRRHW